MLAVLITTEYYASYRSKGISYPHAKVGRAHSITRTGHRALKSHRCCTEPNAKRQRFAILKPYRGRNASCNELLRAWQAAFNLPHQRGGCGAIRCLPVDYDEVVRVKDGDRVSGGAPVLGDGQTGRFGL